MTRVAGVVLLALVLVPTARAHPSAIPSAMEDDLPLVRPVAVSYRLPVPGPPHVVRPFDPPVTRYGPGHLGVDLRTTPGAEVRAAAAGQVSYAGSVAGRGVVVVVHADGIRTEYEPLTVAVRAGRSVAAGEVLGRLHGTHGRCAPQRCLHWGARRGSTYLDPLTLLRRLGPVRLLPWLAGTG